mmetsp:Transcript_25431/g.64663  ORF Transcript_25431/g.64663 Transcript_25431/m.64663 type:complete len:281 (+) Transcript_25431:3-845(+)
MFVSMGCKAGVARVAAAALSSEGPRVLLDLHQDRRVGDHLLSEGRLLLREALGHDLLQARPVKEQLSEDLLQNLLAVAKVGEGRHNILVNAVRLLLPLPGEVAHYQLHLCHVDARRWALLPVGPGRRLVASGDRWLSVFDKHYEVRVVPHQLVLHEQLDLLAQQGLEPSCRRPGQVPLMEDCEHQVIIVHKEDEAILGAVQLLGHRLRQSTNLLLHGLERLLQRVRQAAAGLRGAEGVQTRSQLRISPRDEVRVSVGWDGHALMLLGLPQRHDVGVKHNP